MLVSDTVMSNRAPYRFVLIISEDKGHLVFYQEGKLKKRHKDHKAFVITTLISLGFIPATTEILNVAPNDRLRCKGDDRNACVRTCVRGKESSFIPVSGPLLSAPWRSQMPVTSPRKDKREGGEPDTDSHIHTRTHAHTLTHHDEETVRLKGVADP